MLSACVWRQNDVEQQRLVLFAPFGCGVGGFDFYARVGYTVRKPKAVMAFGSGATTRRQGITVSAQSSGAVGLGLTLT